MIRSRRIQWFRSKGAVIALLLLSSFLCMEATAFQETISGVDSTTSGFDVEVMLNNWIRCRSVLDSVGGSECQLIGVARNSTFLNVSQVQIDGDYALKSISDKNEITGKSTVENKFKVIANPHYLAAISMRPDGKWFLDTVQLAGGAVYETSFREYFADYRFVSLTPEFIESLRVCKSRSVKPKTGVGSRSFEVSFVDVSDSLSECVVEVDETHDFMPLSILFRNKDGSQRKHEFSDWVEFEGVSIYTKIIASIPSAPLIANQKYTYTWSPDKLDRKPIRAECFLTAYGLPEPDYPSNLPSYLFGVALLALIAIIIAIVRKRR